MKDFVTVMLACNDDHGTFTGQIEKVEFMVGVGLDAMALCLDNQFWPPAVIAFKPLPDRVGPNTRRALIGRRIFPILGYQTWVGNWCWDAVGMTRATAAQLVNYLAGMKLRETRKWTPDQGWTELFEKYERGEAFTDADFVDREAGEG